MRIGIDFDNTIACYDGVFRRAALERGLVPADIGTSKNAVRDFLNGSGRYDEFTELQGYVYGSRMNLVSCYPGVQAFIAAALGAGHDLYVVSHKTKHPILGPKHDMHAAARGFLAAQRLVGPDAIADDRIFFLTTKEEKVETAARLGCEAFVDDLPQILSMLGLPTGVRAILFDPEGHFPGETRFERHTSWQSIGGALLGSQLRA